MMNLTSYINKLDSIINSDKYKVYYLAPYRVHKCGGDLCGENAIQYLLERYKNLVNDINDIKIIYNNYEYVRNAEVIFIDSVTTYNLNVIKQIINNNPNADIIYRDHDLPYDNDTLVLCYKVGRPYLLKLLNIMNRYNKLKVLVNSPSYTKFYDDMNINNEYYPLNITTNNMKVNKPLKSFNNNVLFVAGYYDELKGNKLLLKLIEKFPINIFNWYIVGFTYPKNVCKEYEHILRRPDVQLVDYTNDLNTYYDLCNIVLSIAPMESYSITTKEAFAHHCLVVTSEFNKIHPWSKNCVCFNPSDINDLYNKMINIKNHEYDKMMNLPYIGYDNVKENSDIMNRWFEYLKNKEYEIYL